jgi:hypothetical protein
LQLELKNEGQYPPTEAAYQPSSGRMASYRSFCLIADFCNKICQHRKFEPQGCIAGSRSITTANRSFARHGEQRAIDAATH